MTYKHMLKRLVDALPTYMYASAPSLLLTRPALDHVWEGVQSTRHACIQRRAR